MYIHSYQIHNVLNVYRKQLGKGALQGNSESPPQLTGFADRVNIAFDGQRQSLVDKISAEIVERLTQFGPETQFEAALADRMNDSANRPQKKELEPDRAFQHAEAFTYTIIDEHNQKRTTTLSVRPFGTSTDGSESSAGTQQDIGVKSET